MHPLFQYEIKVVLATGIFYLVYWLFFRTDNNFQFKRFFLLCGLLLPIVICGLNISIEKPALISENVSYLFVTGFTETPPADSATKEIVPYYSFSINQFIMLFQLAIVFSLFLRLSLGLGKIVALISFAKSHHFSDKRILVTEEQIITFSFFRNVVINKKLIGQQDLKDILRHEKVHVQQGHSIDMLLVEIIKCVFWFNPFVWLLGNSIALNQEYQADAQATGSSENIQNYQWTLLRYAIAQKTTLRMPAFNNSSLKKRIIMLQKLSRPKSSRWKILLAFPAVSVIMFSFSLKKPQDVLSASATLQDKIVKELRGSITTLQDTLKNQQTEKIYNIVDEQPEPAGGMTNLYDYINENLRYPEEAKEHHIVGKVFVQFIVGKTGELRDVKVVKGIGIGCDEEAVRLIKNAPKWKPGVEKGQLVPVRMILPITFSLETKTTSPGSQTDGTVEDKNFLSEKTYSIVDQQPKPPDGMDGFYKYVANNLRYPDQAKAKHTEGKVFVQFIVDKTGKLRDIKVAKGIGNGCDEEAVRLVENAPKWTPGIKDGQPVPVRVIMPITFNLKPKSSSKTQMNDSLKIYVDHKGGITTICAKTSDLDTSPVWEATLSSGFSDIQNRKNMYPKYFIDKREVNEQEIRHLNPLTINSVNVLVPKIAEEKFGPGFENGVFIINTK